MNYSKKIPDLKRFKYILLLFHLFLFTSCKKDGFPCIICFPEDEACTQSQSLPSETQIGADTLGFLKNGVVWVNYGKKSHLFMPTTRCDVRGSLYNYHGYNRFNMSTCRFIKCDDIYVSDEYFYIEINNFNNIGTYLMDSTHIRNITLNDSRLAKCYQTNHKNPGTLHVSKLDTINKIISGTFHAILYNTKNEQDSTTITQGRFDISY